MIKELISLQNSVFKQLNYIIFHLHTDLECEEYLGYNFQLNQYNIKFRKAKITPKKTGQFVTLWKRNPNTKQTEPFTTSDHFDFYIIYTELNNRSGFFFFPKIVLDQQCILTNATKEGKRGFRLYPNWDTPQNKQAEKTKTWQQEFFIDFSDIDHLKKFEKMLTL
ncbi:MepB family protein [Chryseobacterium paridis]|uniref:MepB family protein n=1 Tax=Chryseobacterium paridis TaxID=2800328 RepID=A0ABS1FXF0_9FLAO|nr:MepB family protein [Chryseobacterium paridis]MBK1897065.1 MepB family protein [Chryseobacterium paridis]